MEEILARMRKNPKENWDIKDLENVAHYYGITAYKPITGGHTIFSHPKLPEISQSIPNNRPIKPIYITLFTDLVDGVG